MLILPLRQLILSKSEVSDISDDGDDDDGNTVDDQTIVEISPRPSMEVTKSANVDDINGNGENDLGDVITYNIVVINTGNVTLTAITIEDILTDGNSNTLSLGFGPSFNGSSQGSGNGTLSAGESATYIATYDIAQGPANTGSIINTVSATASSPGNTNDVTDISDDPSTIAPNDPTVVLTDSNASIEISKQRLSHKTMVTRQHTGDVIVYTIVVTNTGNVTLLI